MSPSNSAFPKNPKTIFFIFVSYLLSLILISSCAFEEEQLYSKNEAEGEFIRICKEEYEWGVNTKFIGNTLWIYLPSQKDIFKFKANRFAQISKCMAVYLKGDFAEEEFYFEYQFMPVHKTEKDRGYTYVLSDEVNEDFRSLLNVIYRVYLNAEEQPEFYVIVIADIVNGVEFIYTIYNEDLKMAFNNAIASEEQYKRFLQDIRGDLRIINDSTGRHLTYQEISFSQFLTEQIAQRIRYEFASADFDSCSRPEEKILNIFSYVLRTYEFGDFQKITLKNLSTGAQITKMDWELEDSKEF